MVGITVLTGFDSFGRSILVACRSFYCLNLYLLTNANSILICDSKSLNREVLVQATFSSVTQCNDHLDKQQRGEAGSWQ